MRAPVGGVRLTADEAGGLQPGGPAGDAGTVDPRDLSEVGRTAGAVRARALSTG